MTETPKVGLKLKMLAKNLILSPFLASHSIQEFRKKGKSFGADLPHPGCYKVQKVPG